MDENEKTNQPNSGTAQSGQPAAGSEGSNTPMTASQEEQVDPKLLELLVCPLTKTRLKYDPKNHELISKAAGLAFPIKDGVPLMIVDAARQLED